MRQIKQIFTEKRVELLIILALLVVSGVAHAYNMFHFPYYNNDEGTYMSQAWSVLTQGKLAPYTYWYDHAPAGWFLIALWVKLTGGFFTFGPSVNSGRVLMLALHLATSYLLFYVAKRLTRSNLPGIIAVLIFSLSPLGIYFQRRVLLDNIMIFWVFVSLALLLKRNLKLRHVLISAVTFGIAVLTKESAVFFLPAFLYTLYAQAHSHHKRFALVKWVAVSGVVISMYFLYALLKSELLPPGFVGNETEHVSLLSTLQYQLGRGTGLPFWHRNSDFYINFVEWISRDWFTMIIGGGATIVSVIASVRLKALRIPAFLAAMFWIFLMRGSLVINFYVIPLIALLALNIGLLWGMIAERISFGKGILYYPSALVSVVGTVYIFWTMPTPHFTKNETIPQIEAIEWIKENLSPESYIAIDNYAFVDLHDSRFIGDSVYENADWFMKISLDSEIREGKYTSDWTRLDFILLGHEIVEQMRLERHQFLEKAFENAYLVADWSESSTSYIDLDNRISTNGDWASIYKVKDKPIIVLEKSWEYFRENFIRDHGRVVDPHNNLSTTSEGQSYAMLRAVWMGDKETFDGVWQWTQDHLQFREHDRLFSWLWAKDGENYTVVDPASASDADADIALALLFAYQQWGNQHYLEDATSVINDIWENEVVEINGQYHLTSGSNAAREGGYLLNPSYLSPASYRIFAQVDPNHQWERLAEDNYTLLNQLAEWDNNQTGLPPNWVLIESETGEIQSASPYINSDADNYGFDAFRVMWRVALDAKWFGSTEAFEYLQTVKPFLGNEYLSGRIYAVYNNATGDPTVNFESLSTSTGAWALLTITDKSLADEIYQVTFDRTFDYDDGHWGDPENYYDQNWAWFGTALYSDNLPNLWNAKSYSQ